MAELAKSPTSALQRRLNRLYGVHVQIGKSTIRGACPDEDLPEVFGSDHGENAKAQADCPGKRGDVEVKERVFVDFTICLQWGVGHISSKQTSQLTGFVKD